VRKDARWYLLQGYLAYKQGYLEEANMDFLQAEELTNKLTNNGEQERFLSYIHYAQSAVLLMQNEIDVAAEKLRMIGKLDEEDNIYLISSVYYQMGLVCFARQDYRESASYFKKSLEAQPHQLDAKINYELSMKKIEEEKIKSLRTSVLNEMEGDEAYNTLLDVFRKREVEEWSEKREKERENAINDY